MLGIERTGMDSGPRKVKRTEVAASWVFYRAVVSHKMNGMNEKL